MFIARDFISRLLVQQVSLNQCPQEPVSKHVLRAHDVRSSTKRICIVLVCTVLFLDQVCVTMLLPVLPQIIHISSQDNSTDTTFAASNGTGTQFHLLGLIFGVKGIAQLFCTPLVGVLIDYSCPLVSLAIGLVVNAAFLAIYAFESHIHLLFLCRCLQGLAGSAFLTGSFAEIADLFPRANERRKLTAVANVATFIGGAVGPSYGGLSYQFSGRAVTFWAPFALILAAAGMIIAVRERFRQRHLRIESQTEDTKKPTPIFRLIADPFIIITTVGLVIGNFSHNCWYPTLPSWMHDQLKAQEWEQGVVWTPSAFFYISGAGLTTWLCRRFPRHRHVAAFVTFVLSASHILALPFFRHLVAVAYVIGLTMFCTAAIEVVLFPILPNIVDARYTEVYGSVSSFTSAAFSLASILGSFLAGYVTDRWGFLVLNICIASAYVLFAPLVFFVRQFS